MKNIIYAFALSIGILTFNACGNDDDGILSLNLDAYDCTFEQIDRDMDGAIDQAERDIMKECTENAFDNLEEIKSNLIGNWELVGFGHGWFHTVSQPCSYIEIEQDKLTYKYDDGGRDILETVDWEVREIDWPSNPPRLSFSLETEPFVGLSIVTFCESYMFTDGTPADGNMYLYQKVD